VAKEDIGKLLQISQVVVHFDEILEMWLITTAKNMGILKYHPTSLKL
jgi:hypothetical protein